MKKNTKQVIFIIGPTAIGKTSLAIKLAKAIQCEIISCDSRQFYKELKIGTAPPSTEELAEVKHHFIQNLSIKDNYNAGEFELDALNKIEELHKKNNSVIVVGGSGLYINAICKGFDKIPKVSSTNREWAINLYKKNGLDWLQKEVKTIDPDFYAHNDIQNPNRLLRQLEVFKQTGEPVSRFKSNTIKKRHFKIIKIGLNMQRSLLYERINKRVDTMIKSGLLDEVKSLLNYKDFNALQTVGYKELFMFLEEKISLDQAIENMKKNTRRFAKRQLTWFRKDKEIKWIQNNELSETLNIISK